MFYLVIVVHTQYSKTKIQCVESGFSSRESKRLRGTGLDRHISTAKSANSANDRNNCIFIS